jgi:hypothetical protein
LENDPVEAVTAAVKHVHEQLLGRTSGPKSDMTFSGTTACFVVSLGVRFAGSMEGRGLHSFTLALNLSNSRTHL